MDHIVEHVDDVVVALAVVLDDPVDGVLELLVVLDDLRDVLVDVMRVLGLLVVLDVDMPLSFLSFFLSSVNVCTLEIKEIASCSSSFSNNSLTW